MRYGESGKLEVVNIPDKYLKKLINNTIDENRSDDQNILKSDLIKIKKIDGMILPKVNDDTKSHFHGICSLEGLQYAENLEHLILKENKISDLSPLSNLKKLKFLNLHRNDISDLTPLSNLINLEHLDIYNNEGITTMDPLINLKNLKFIDLHFCNRGKYPVDVEALGELTNLEFLSIESNFIEDISFAKNLTKLNSFSCAVNHVTDLSPISKLASRAYSYDNDDFLNMYMQTLKDPIVINPDSTKLSFKNPVKGLEEYIGNLRIINEIDDSIEIPALEMLDDFPGSITYNYDNNTIDIDANLWDKKTNQDFKITLDYAWYTLTIDIKLQK